MPNGGIAVWTCVLAGLLVTAPAQAAFPGKPGPIAYSYSNIDEAEGPTGGIRIHGPRKREAPRQLTEETADSSPSYSPNGRLIAFSSNRDPGSPRPLGTHVYVMTRLGVGITQITSGEFFDSNPSFSPDGRSVVFDRYSLQDRVKHIFRVAIDGTGLRQISNGTGNDFDPVYAPNGKRIVFASDRRRSGRRDRSNIFSMRPSGKGVRLLIGGPRNEFDPDVSPNGRKIVFASNRAHGPNLFVAKINGKRVRALTHSRGDCFRGTCYTNPSWAPDGKHIVYLSGGRYSSEIGVMRADGRGFSKEFDGGGTEAEGFGSTVGPPSWGPRPR